MSASHNTANTTAALGSGIKKPPRPATAHPRRVAKPTAKKTAPPIHTADQEKLDVTAEDVEWRYLL